MGSTDWLTLEEEVGKGGLVATLKIHLNKLTLITNCPMPPTGQQESDPHYGSLCIPRVNTMFLFYPNPNLLSRNIGPFVMCLLCST